MNNANRMWRRLAPVGGLSSPGSILMAARSVWQTRSGAPGHSVERVLEESVRGTLGPAYVRWVESGTHGLSLIFSALRQNGISKISCGAYTCPDIVTAAIHAGVTLELLDIDAHTLEPKLSDGVVLLSNLYGLPDKLPVGASAIIDDGCQAALSLTPEGHVGSRRGCVGVLSFGRGKSLPGIGGGAILAGHNAPTELTAFLQRSSDRGGGTPASTLAEGAGWAKALLSWALARPALYGIPASFPFLHLGETQFHRELHRQPWSNAMGYVALSALSRQNALRRTQVELARRWHTLLAPLGLVEPFLERGYDFGGSTVPIRYPVLVLDISARDRLLQKLRSFGVTGSYPGVLPDLCPGIFQREDLPGARSVAASILTLPVHEYVTERDIEAVAAIMKAELER